MDRALGVMSAKQTPSIRDAMTNIVACHDFVIKCSEHNRI